MRSSYNTTKVTNIGFFRVGNFSVCWVIREPTHKPVGHRRRGGKHREKAGEPRERLTNRENRGPDPLWVIFGGTRGDL
jgi:hypothetical protein